MRKKGKMFFTLGVLGGIFFPLGFAYSSVDILTRDADVSLESPSALFFPNDILSLEARGDFNGDGVQDIAIYMLGEVHLVLGRNFQRRFDLDRATDLKILHVGGSQLKMAFADLDGDHKDDLIIHSGGGALDPENVRVLYGRSIQSPASINLTTTLPDLTLVGKAASRFGVGFAAGDVHGEGHTDILIGAPLAAPLGRREAGEVYLVRGKKARRTGTFDVTLSTEVTTFLGRPNAFSTTGGDLGTTVCLGDINQDHKKDLFLSAPDAPNGLFSPGIIYVIYGRASFISPILDLNFTSPDRSILGLGVGFGGGSLAVETGDMDGDGRADPLVFSGYFSQPFLTDGNLLLSGPQQVDLSAVSVPVGSVGISGAFGDFDGDGKADLFVLPDVSRLNVYLSSDFPGFSVPTLSTASFSVAASLGGVIGAYSVGDVNGDGYADLNVMEVPNASGASLKGFVHIFYGFPPMKHPLARIRERTPESTSVILDLSVDGNPTEVRVSGDVTGGDRWVPFQPALSVRLSPGQGSRKVRVTFRNRLQRESETVEDTVVLTSGEPETRTLTNILRADAGANGRVTVECQVTEPTRIKAGVYDRRGHLLVDVKDEERGPGVWPVEWDGLNASGRRVAPGVYFLQVEANGRAQRHRIVVRG